MTGIPAADFTSQWGVPAADLGKPMKDIKDQYGFTPEDVRAWVDAAPRGVRPRGAACYTTVSRPLPRRRRERLRLAERWQSG